MQADFQVDKIMAEKVFCLPKKFSRKKYCGRIKIHNRFQLVTSRQFFKVVRRIGVFENDFGRLARNQRQVQRTVRRIKALELPFTVPIVEFL